MKSTVKTIFILLFTAQSCLSSETIQTEKLKQHLASVSYAGKENAISLLLNHGADTNDVGYLPEELSDSTDAWLTLFKCKDNSSHQVCLAQIKYPCFWSPLFLTVLKQKNKQYHTLF